MVGRQERSVKDMERAMIFRSVNFTWQELLGILKDKNINLYLLKIFSVIRASYYSGEVDRHHDDERFP